MQRRILLATIILTAMLSSCSEKVQDVQYYIDHPDEREKVIKDCYNNPGEKAGTPNCINAMKAQDKTKQFKMPSIEGALDNYKK